MGRWPTKTYESDRDRLRDQLRALIPWLAERNVQQAVMESTAQYRKTVWRELEAELSSCKLHLAQALATTQTQCRPYPGQA